MAIATRQEHQFFAVGGLGLSLVTVTLPLVHYYAIPLAKLPDAITDLSPELARLSWAGVGTDDTQIIIDALYSNLHMGAYHADFILESLKMYLETGKEELAKFIRLPLEAEKLSHLEKLHFCLNNKEVLYDINIKIKMHPSWTEDERTKATQAFKRIKAYVSTLIEADTTVTLSPANN
jgi:hypothetical protein